MQNLKVDTINCTLISSCVSNAIIVCFVVMMRAPFDAHMSLPSGCVFRGSRLGREQMEVILASGGDLRGADLSGTDLSGLDLTVADLTAANLGG
jgi:uncharacterized protein YjbI with pentapeptide repeats